LVWVGQDFTVSASIADEIARNRLGQYLIAPKAATMADLSQSHDAGCGQIATSLVQNDG
jgi:hypothetical protein